VLNLEKKRWEEPTELVRERKKEAPQSIGDKVKGLFSWFGSGHKEEAEVQLKEDKTNLIRPRNLTFHQGKT